MVSTGPHLSGQLFVIVIDQHSDFVDRQSDTRFSLARLVCPPLLWPKVNELKP